MMWVSRSMALLFQCTHLGPFASRIGFGSASVASVQLGPSASHASSLVGHCVKSFAVWTSGDATMTRMAGINWKLKEYFQLEHEGLLKDPHQGENREYQISEIELITLVGVVVFWGDLWNGRRIILLASGNRNTFSWIDNRVAKKGLPLRLIATFHAWCVENGIEVYPFYLGSLRNSRPDFITRESDRGSSLWAERAGYSRVLRPWWWTSVLECAPRLGRIEDRVVNFPQHLNYDAIGLIGPVAEWRPTSGALMQIYEGSGLRYSALGGLNMCTDYRADSTTEWRLIFGSVRHHGEMEGFRTYLDLKKPQIAAMATPSEIEYELWFSGDFWAQSWKCDSVKFGDCLAGTWNVYRRIDRRFACLDLGATGRMISSLRRVFSDYGLDFLRPPIGVSCIRSIENSIGKTILVKRSNGEQLLSPDSQIPPYNRRTAFVGEFDWPISGHASRQPKIRGNLLAFGSHHAWITANISVKDQTSATWELYPREVVRKLMFEIFQPECEETMRIQTVRKPGTMWERGPHRTGWYEKLDQIVNSATGYRKLEALMSGMSIGTGKTYIHGWKHWAQYCSLRWMSQWVVVGKPGRGGKILDFITFGHAVSGANSSTTCDKI